MASVWQIQPEMGRERPAPRVLNTKVYIILIIGRWSYGALHRREVASFSQLEMSGFSPLEMSGFATRPVVQVRLLPVRYVRS